MRPRPHFDGEPDYLKRMRQLFDNTAPQEDTRMDSIDLVIALWALGVFSTVVAACSWLFTWIVNWTHQAQQERIELSDARVLRRYQR